MTVTRETLDGVRKFAKLFQPVIDLAESLEGVEAMKQLEGERRQLLADVTGKLDVAELRLSEALGRVRDAETALTGLKKNAEDAGQRATDTINAARREAAQIIKDARAEAQTEFDQLMADAMKRQAEVETKIGSLRAERNHLEQELADRRAVLATVEGQIDKAKAHIASILRGV